LLLLTTGVVFLQGIYQACKGFGTDELRLIKELAVLSPEDRCKVSLRYKEVHGKELKDVLKRECRGDFGEALQFLAVPPDVAECDMIKKACKGIGTDETLVYSIICGRSNKEMEILKKKFFDRYEKDLGRQLDSELSGDFEKMIYFCLQGMEQEFDPDFHTDDKVAEDVATFYKMGEGKFGTDESGLFKLICTSPSEHLKKVNQMYADKHDVTLFKAIDDEMSGKTQDATLFLLGMKLKPYETVAKLIQKACKGIGTNELLLTCTIIRFQPHLPQVMAAYEEVAGKTLQETIRKEIGGDYRRLLTELVDASS
jgi:Annexin